MRTTAVRASLLFALVFSVADFAGEVPSGASPEEALQRLVAGNRRFAAGRPDRPDATVQRRQELAKEQHPFAIILGCSDSRVPPEIIFDQGLGDLFVIRDAGNVLDHEVIGSIEYAVEHLGSRLIVVLGHEGCGAVTAAVQGGESPGHIKKVVGSISPALKATKSGSGDRVHNCVIANAKISAERLRKSTPILKPRVDSGALKVVAADYNLASGTVDFLKD